MLAVGERFEKVHWKVIVVEQLDMHLQHAVRTELYFAVLVHKSFLIAYITAFFNYFSRGKMQYAIASMV